MTKKNEIANQDKTDSWLRPWMKFCLCFCAAIDVVFGLFLVVLFDFAYQALAIPVTTLPLPIQLLGLFYLMRGGVSSMVALDIDKNSNQLFGVLLTRVGSSIFVMVYVVFGRVPLAILPVSLIVDLIFVIPIWMIYNGQSGVSQSKKL